MYILNKKVQNNIVMIMEKEKLKENLSNMISESTSAFSCINYLKTILLKENFIELKETEKWNLEEKNYFIIRNDASLIAFKISKKKENFHIITTHCDTPSLLLKPKGENIKEKFLKYNIMPYGGLLNYGWLDHPLSLSGRVIFRKNNKLIKKIIDLKETIATVPSVAIHQNDKANTNLDLNMQTDLQPIFALNNKEESWKTLLKKKLKIKKEEEICDYDLFLYNNSSPTYFGLNDELLLSPRIDNITSVSAAFESFLESKELNINVFCTFNNEEIGSLTKEGADGNFLIDTIKRIAGNLGLDIASTLAKSFIISSDNTHGVHPNHQEYADDTGRAYLGDGFAIVKEISSTTDSYFSSIIKTICDSKNIHYQDATAKNDLTGGSTLSGISLRHLSVTSIDVGIPELAMHSSIETCSINDYFELYKMMKEFYNTKITIEKENTFLT